MTELTEQQKRVIRAFIERGEPISSGCACMGPRFGEPLCSCAMRWVMMDEGHYFKITKVLQEFGYTYHVANIGPVGGPYTVEGVRQ